MKQTNPTPSEEKIEVGFLLVVFGFIFGCIVGILIGGLVATT